MICYWEYGRAGTTRVTEAEAINRMKEVAAKKGKVYPNDEEALKDFVVIHWAWKEEK
jgi:hypothetical protein